MLKKHGSIVRPDSSAFAGICYQAPTLPRAWLARSHTQNLSMRYHGPPRHFCMRTQGDERRGELAVSCRFRMRNQTNTHHHTASSISPEGQREYACMCLVVVASTLPPHAPYFWEEVMRLLGFTCLHLNFKAHVR
jgi:hypothetical protein